MTPVMTGWNTSSFSQNNAACVEVSIAERVLIRDTKDRGGPMLDVTLEQWQQFLDHLVAGVVTTDLRVRYELEHRSYDGDPLPVPVYYHLTGNSTTLHFTAAEWRAFLRGVRNGEFNVAVPA